MKTKRSLLLPLLLALPVILLAAAAVIFAVPQLHDALLAGAKLAVIP